jgi:hypothetical protein
MPPNRRLTIRPRPAEDYDEDRSQPRRLRREDNEADDDQGMQVNPVARGISGYKRTKANAPSPFTKFFRVESDEKLIMMLEDQPYASYLMHWCEWVAKGQRMSYVCLQPCPLDEVDPKPQTRIRWNILDCSGDTPLHVPYECGTSVTDMLIEWGEDEPLSGRYFGVQMKGAKNNRRTQVRPVKIRDLKEDWEFDPLSEDTIAKFQEHLFDSSSITVSTKDELRKVADAYNE